MRCQDLEKYYTIFNPFNTLLVVYDSEYGRMCALNKIARNFSGERFDQTVILAFEVRTLEMIRHELGKDAKRFHFGTVRGIVERGSNVLDHRLIFIVHEGDIDNLALEKLTRSFQKSIGSRLVWITANPSSGTHDVAENFINLYNSIVERKYSAVKSDFFKGESVLNVDGFSCSRVLNYDPKTSIAIPNLIPEKRAQIRNNLFGRVAFLKPDALRLPTVFENPDATALSPLRRKQILRLEFSPEQLLMYTAAFKKDCETETDELISFPHSRQAADFVFENGEYGPAGIVAYFKQVSKNVFGSGTILQLRRKEDIVMFRGDRLRTQSTKFAYLFENISRLPGIHFIFNDRNADLLAFVLKANGFTDFPRGEPMMRFLEMDKKMVGDPQFAKIISLVNSEKNTGGEIARVIISDIADPYKIPFLKNVRHIHLLTPCSDAIIERMSYQDSHEMLEPAQRTIAVHRYAAAFPPAPDSGISIDEFDYHVISEKEHVAGQLTQLLRDSSFDCSLFKKKSDVEKCVAQYAAPGKRPNSDDIENVVNKITPLFARHFVLTVESIQQMVRTPRPDLIHFALDKIVSERVRVLDRYGRTGTVIYRGKYYVVTPIGMKPNVSYWERVAAV